ncbi:hypothetical protein PC41400_20665 [Paenibacillus chitinolyticus]|uniref:Uncharacterized protein n=2 Tax=Paenibacillus chitinolyticus TaxID=79263 RepID=A0A410WZQ8_9BACL|nr:hypothetical protein PC41400_20665 [Paenibacillus chitinolyticus]
MYDEMIYGTMLLETDIELFAAALSQTEVYIWGMDHNDVYVQIGRGFIEKYNQDQVKIRSSLNSCTMIYSREKCEFSAKTESAEEQPK